MAVKIDVIMATYNGEAYIKKQLDSILNQTYTDIRLIISDDCSKDGTREILKSYAKADGRIELFLQSENLGVTKNFEFLLTKCEASLIAYSDQDDIWHADKLEKLAAVHARTGADLIWSDMRRIDSNGKVICESYLKQKSFPKIKGSVPVKCASKHFATGCSQLFTNAVARFMLPFKPEVTAHDWISVFAAASLRGIAFVKEPLVDYRLHSANVFGGKNYKDNIKKGMGQYGSDYAGFLKYRENVINTAHLNGINMAYAYTHRQEYDNLAKYLGSLIKVKAVSLNMREYFKSIYTGGVFKRTANEMLVLFFPALYYVFCRFSARENKKTD